MSKKDEDYLDNLLKNMGQPSGDSDVSDGAAKSAMERLGKPAPVRVPDKNTGKTAGTPDRSRATAGSAKEKSGTDGRPGIEDISDLSEDDIENMINAAKDSAEKAKKADAERKRARENQDITEMDGLDGDEDISDISRLLKSSDRNVAADSSVDDILKKSAEASEGKNSPTLDDLIAGDWGNVDGMIRQTESEHAVAGNGKETKKNGEGIGARLKGIFGGSEAKKAEAKEKAAIKKAASEKKAAAKKAAAEKKAEDRKSAAEKKSEAKKAAAEKKTAAKNAAEEKASVQKAVSENKPAVSGNAAGKPAAEKDTADKNVDSGVLKDDDIESLINEMNKAAEQGTDPGTGMKETPAVKDKKVEEADLMAAAEEVRHDDQPVMTGGADDGEDEIPLIPGADTDEEEPEPERTDPDGQADQVQGAADNADHAAEQGTEEKKNENGGRKKSGFGFKLKKNKNKGKADEGKTSGDTADSKKSLIAKFLEFVNADDDDEEQESAAAGGIGPDGLPTGNVSDENQQVLDEIDADGDDAKGKKGKKGKKLKKDKKGKKGADSEESDSEDEDGEKAGAGKKEKKKKKKKEKKADETAGAGVPEKTEKLPKKKVILTAAFSVTLTVCIMVLCYVLPMQLTLNRARNAFEKADYESAYEELYGRKLNASDQEIYNKSSIILQVDRKYEAYENYKKMGKKLEGLDSLIQGVARYNSLKDQAQSYGILDKIKSTYDKIVKALKDDYGISEKKANEIAASKDDLTYTKNVYDALGEPVPGTASGSKSNGKNTQKSGNAAEMSSETSAETGTASDQPQKYATDTAQADSTEGSGWAAAPNDGGTSAGSDVSGNSAGSKQTAAPKSSDESVMYVIHTK
jgi:hypothetical protein